MFGYCKSDSEIPIVQLDYRFVENCNDANKLQRILKILRSGEEGDYPDLIKFTEQKLRKCNPKSALLGKIEREKTTRELQKDERDGIIENLQALKTDYPILTNGYSTDHNLPPVRNSKNIDIDSVHREQKQANCSSSKTNNRVAPRSYDEWSKLDQQIEKDGLDETKLKTEAMRKNKENEKPVHELLGDLRVTEMTEQEQELKAESEKSKGNEAFRSADYNEALVYYNRSIRLKPIIAVHNNRAMTRIHLEQYEDAIEDCNVVLKAEPDNIKAFLRRGLAYKSLKKLELALPDFEKVLEMQPGNKRGKELYESVYKELENLREKQTRNHPSDTKKGKRLVIEEVENKENDEDNSGSKTTENSGIIDTSNVDGTVCTSEATTAEKETTPTVEETTIVEEKATRVEETTTTTAVAAAFTFHKELPADVVKLKDEGNVLYKAGQYLEAYEKYTTALHELMPDSEHFLAAIGSLFNNRAICQSKSGHCKECIHDCTKSLKYYPSIKALLRRANAYETVEKYALAYVDYEAAYNIDKAATTLHSMSRISNMLKKEYSKSWRDQLPKVEPINWAVLTAAASTRTTLSTTTTTTPLPITTTSTPLPTTTTTHSLNGSIDTISSDNVAAPTENPTNVTHESTKTEIQPKVQVTSKQETRPPVVETTVVKSVEEKFKETKDKGNKCAQEAKYKEAITFYTECIQLLPAEVTSYTNRALCYLKTKQPKNAVDDCNKALEIQPDIIKALFRRAQAQKLMKEYKHALTDLASVMKLEPKNTAAKKEMEECKELFRTELRELQERNESNKQTGSSKKSKKMKIEEVFSESLNTQNKSKGSTKAETCPMAKNNQTTPTANNRFPSSKKINSFEFMQMWNGIKSKKSADYAEILKQVEPNKLPELLSNKIDGEILTNFVRAIHDHFTSKEHYKCGISLMKNMSRVQRFSTMLMFLGTPEKTLIKQTVETLEGRTKQCGERTTQTEMNHVRSAYRCSSPS